MKYMRMQYKIIAVSLFVLFFAVQTQAVIKMEVSLMRFQGNTISVGDPVGQLLKYFGKPYHKEKQTNWIRVGRNRVVEREAYVWFYQLGGEYGGKTDDYKFVIYDGQVKKIVEITY